jgi:hypothetical protein
MAFARLLGEFGLPVFESAKAENRTLLFIFNILIREQELGPLLDK